MSERRLTRSQAKRKRELLTRNQKIKSNVSIGRRRREACSQASKSPETTESIANLAKESLEMGKVLGLKVIGKEEVAVKGLISSLKNERQVRLKTKPN